MELHERIKKARKEAGYKSQESLAEFLGTTRPAIMSYEMGRVVPNDVFLQLMATKLHISYDWLKFGKGEMKDTDADSLAALLDDNSLGEDDKEIMRVYIALTPEARQNLKDFALKVAAAELENVKEPPKTENDSRLVPLSDEEWEVVKRLRKQNAPPEEEPEEISAMLTAAEWEMLQMHRNSVRNKKKADSA